MEVILVILLPLLGGILGGLFMQKSSPRFTEIFTSTLVAISAICSWYLLLLVPENNLIELGTWFNSGDFKVKWAIYADKLTKIMFVVVTSISALVHVYSIGYMHEDTGRNRFFSYLSLFTASMLILVSSSNLLQMFLGWEGVGACSYLLIGFWYKKESANAAAIKAFLVNRVGDLGLLLGICLLFKVFGTVEFKEIFTAIPKYLNNQLVNINTITLISLLLFFGCMGKSAQIGLHTWLPDAMEGPTPVSALIHAATMVTAGVFLIVRISPLIEAAPIAKIIIIIIGMITALFASTVATMQTDIKKIIAYSTCSQLGYMFIACGFSAYWVAIFHLFTHAFFKALLFLCAGNIIHATEGEQNIQKMGGLYKLLPFTYCLTWIGSLALTGIFPFAGFYSKELIIESSVDWPLIFSLSTLVVFFTSIYSSRLLLKVFHGTSKVKEAHEPSLFMLIPLIFLGIGSILAGYGGVKFLHIQEKDFWQFSNVILTTIPHINFFQKILPTIFAFSGFFIFYLFYFRNDKNDYLPTNKFTAGPLTVIRNKFYIDELYKYFLINPLQHLSKFCAQILDVKIIDRLGPLGVRATTYYAGNVISKIQSGYIYDYVFCMLWGMVVIFTWAIIEVVNFKSILKLIGI